MFQEDFSVGIAKNNHAFSVRYKRLSNKRNTSEVVAACVAFLERGLPTILHRSLEEDLTKFLGDERLNEAIRDGDRLLVSSSQNWDDVIKGSDEFNPAKDFWKHNLSSIDLGDITLNSIFYPEIAFGDLVKDFPDGNTSKDQQVDFYNPLLNLVIEIDGSQHQSPEQASSDDARDNFLKKHKLKVLRIPVSSLLDNSEELKRSLADLREQARFFKLDQQVATNTSHPSLIKVIAAIRFQRVILALIQAGYLSLDPKKWRFEVISEEFENNEVFEVAAANLLKTMNVFSSVISKDIFEEVNTGNMFVSSDSSIKIDFSTCSVFDSSTLDENTIYVRNNPIIYEYLEGNKVLADYSKAHLNFGKPSKDRVSSNKNNFEQLLKYCLNFSKFRTGQFEIIEGALQKFTMLGLLPTGAGKSLTFQFPSIIENGCTIVVCPITALVRDHVSELEMFGYKRRVASITADVRGVLREHVHRRLKQGKLQFLFVSPEQFQNANFRSFVKSACNDQLISRFVIDEAHCLSEWGHDFRTSYLTLSNTLKNIGPKVPILCLTATASVNVMRELQIEFDISDDNVIYTMNQSRPELDFDVKIASDKDKYLKEILNNKVENNAIGPDKAALIFFPTVNNRANGAFPKLTIIRDILKNEKVGLFTGEAPKKWDQALEEQYFYGFELSNSGAIKRKPFELYKEKVQKLFKNNNLTAIAATKSFGMGVNKPNIRTIIHYGLPSSIEALYQEAGRAGRDGHLAECFSLVNLAKKVDPIISNVNSTYEELESWQDDDKILKDDIDTQVFLLLNSSLANSEEINRCMALLNDLRRSGQSPTLIGVRGTFGYGDKGKKSEKTIYRLYQLGVITDWTVKNHKVGVYNITWRDLTSDVLRQNFLKMVKKYEANELDYQNKLNEINNMKDITEVDEGSDLHTVTSLILWNKLTFFKYRRQSLLHLCQAYKDFNPEDPEKFKRLLDAYFEVSKNTHSLLDAITGDPDNVVDLVWSVFTAGGNSITDKRLEEVGGAITRFSESYPDSMALDLAYSIRNGIRVDFDQDLSSGVKDRFFRFIDRIQSLKDPLSSQILKDLYNRVTVSGENALSRTLIEELNEENFANWAMQEYNHNGPFVYLLSKLNNSLENRL